MVNIPENLVQYETVSILEGLLYENKDLKYPLQILDIISIKNVIQPIQKKHLSSILSDFTPPFYFISIASTLYTTALISINPGAGGWNKIPILFISGQFCYKKYLSPSELFEDLYENMKFKDFFPEPFMRKIIFIDGWNKKECYGVCLSEVYQKGRKIYWTVNNFDELPVKETKPYNIAEILGIFTSVIKEQLKIRKEGKNA